MNDQVLQKTYGLIRYGMDFNAWTQQKLSLQGSFGRSIQDAEASTILQYNKAAAGASVSAIARQAGQGSQAPVAVGQSVTR
jgi:hypothetical protein